MKAKKLSHGEWTSCARFIAGGRSIVSSGEDGVIRSWTRAGALQHELREPSYSSCIGTRHGTLVAAYNGDGGTIALWDAGTGASIRTLPGHPIASRKHTSGANTCCAALAADATTLASGGFDDAVRLWNVETGAARRAITVGALPYALAFSRDGSLLAVGVFPKKVLVMATATGKKIAEATASKNAVTSVVFMANGELVTGGGGGELVRWRLVGAKLVQVHAYVKPDGGGIEGVAISPDDSLLAAASRARWTRVWELESGRERRDLAREGELGLGVDFTPDGQHLVIAGPSPLAIVSVR